MAKSPPDLEPASALASPEVFALEAAKLVLCNYEEVVGWTLSLVKEPADTGLVQLIEADRVAVREPLERRVRELTDERDQARAGLGRWEELAAKHGVRASDDDRMRRGLERQIAKLEAEPTAVVEAAKAAGWCLEPRMLSEFVTQQQERIASLEELNARNHAALAAISAIRDDIIGRQAANWSAHIYPLVAALGTAGFEGLGYEAAREKAKTQDERIAELEAQLLDPTLPLLSLAGAFNAALNGGAYTTDGLPAEAVDELGAAAALCQRVTELEAQLASAPRWIPVEERKPEHGQGVLLRGYYGDGDEFFHPCSWPPAAIGDAIYDITHWMAIPELPPPAAQKEPL